MKNINQNGRSMIEMIGVLSIVGILTVGGFGLVSKMQENQRINEVIDNITSFAYKVRPILRNLQVSDTSNINYYLYNAKSYPEDLEYGSSDFVDRNNVRYKIYRNNLSPESANSVNNGGPLFVIGISGFTEKMCLQIATINFGSKASSGYVGMEIGNSNPSGGNLTGQRTIAQAVSQCNGSTKINIGFR